MGSQVRSAADSSDDGELADHYQHTIALALQLNAQGKAALASKVVETLTMQMRAAGFYAFMIEAAGDGLPDRAGGCAIRSRFEEAKRR